MTRFEKSARECDGVAQITCPTAMARAAALLRLAGCRFAAIKARIGAMPTLDDPDAMISCISDIEELLDFPTTGAD